MYHVEIDPAIRIAKAVFETDWGPFDIPNDVPMRVIRKDGWFDRRKKETPAVKRYFNEMADRLRDKQPILTWAEWTQEAKA